MKLKKYLKSALQNLGLTRGESELYLKILKNPQISASNLIDLGKFSTSGTYKILNSLTDQNLVKATKEKSTKFSAIPLNKLAKKFASKGRKLQRIAEKISDFNDINQLPEDTEILEENDLSNFYVNIPTKIDDFIWCVGSFEAVVNFFGSNIEKEFIKNRSKRGVHADAIIFDNSEYSYELAGRDTKEKRETKIIPHNNYPLVFSYLFGNTYINFHKSPNGQIKILKSESSELARAKLFQYQTLWNSTK